MEVLPNGIRRSLWKFVDQIRLIASKLGLKTFNSRIHVTFVIVVVIVVVVIVYLY